MLPLIVLLCILVGSIVRSIYGWMDSGEVFVKRKFAASMIFTIFAVALPATTAIYASSIFIDNTGVIGLVVSSLFAGWGADSGLKVLTAGKDLSGEKK